MEAANAFLPAFMEDYNRRFAIVENKRLGPILAYVAERQKELDMKRSQKASRRQGQGKSISKVG